MLSFWVYFLEFSPGSTITPPVLTPSPFCGSNYQITKSQAFETNYYGHPVVAADTLVGVCQHELSFCMRTLTRYSGINNIDQYITEMVLRVYTMDTCSIKTYMHVLNRQYFCECKSQYKSLIRKKKQCYGMMKLDKLEQLRHNKPRDC